jgi:hypothetical protein
MELHSVTGEWRLWRSDSRDMAVKMKVTYIQGYFIGLYKNDAGG